jgi:hypothetical protein
MNWIYQDPNNHNFGMTSTSLLIEVRPTAISSFWRVFETCTPTLWIPVNYGGLENVVINLEIRCLVAGLPVSFWVNFWDLISISRCKVLLQRVLIYCIVCSDLSFPCMETCKGAGIPPLVCSYMELSWMVDLMCAASGLTFDDSKKQKQYETISFSSIRSEVEEIKV